jgi:hypothetical protein
LQLAREPRRRILVDLDRTEAVRLAKSLTEMVRTWDDEVRS